jgi:hypothetical protein
LAQADLALAGTQHHAEKRAVLFPPLLDREAERFVKRDALLQIVDGETGNDRANLQTFLRCCHDTLLVVPSNSHASDPPRGCVSAAARVALATWPDTGALNDTVLANAGREWRNSILSRGQLLETSLRWTLPLHTSRMDS